MSERVWRLIIGVLILLFLSMDDEKNVPFNSYYALLTLIGWLYFEGLTNIRLTKIVSWLRWKSHYIEQMEKAVSGVKSSRYIPFEAERMLRFAMSSVLLASIFPQLSNHFPDLVAQYPALVVHYPDMVNNIIWAVPWLVGLMLTSAGLTSICPMLMVFQWLGFKSTYH